MGGRLSRVLGADSGGLTDELAAAEEAFFAAAAVSERWNWDEAVIKAAFAQAGLEAVIQTLERDEERLLTASDIAAWFDGSASSWGKYMLGRLGPEAFDNVRRLAQAAAKKGPVSWHWKSLLAVCRAVLFPLR
jgi:hypothetical protein